MFLGGVRQDDHNKRSWEAIGGCLVEPPAMSLAEPGAANMDLGIQPDAILASRERNETVCRAIISSSSVPITYAATLLR
jgi:hypothetical protein